MTRDPQLTIVSCLALVLSGTSLQSQPSALPVHLEPKHVMRFENELVRVFEIVIPPRDSTLFHEHRFDNVAMALDNAELTNELVDRSPAHLRVEPGTVVFSSAAAPYTHRLGNTGSRSARIIAIELKSRPTETVKELPSAEPLSSLLLDNNRVRVRRLSLNPGEVATTPAGSAARVRVMQSGGHAVQTAGKNPGRKLELKVGDLQWLPAGEEHSLRNVGDSQIVLVEFELR